MKRLITCAALLRTLAVVHAAQACDKPGSSSAPVSNGGGNIKVIVVYRQSPSLSNADTAGINVSNARLRNAGNSVLNASNTGNDGRSPELSNTTASNVGNDRTGKVVVTVYYGTSGCRVSDSRVSNAVSNVQNRR